MQFPNLLAVLVVLLAVLATMASATATEGDPAPRPESSGAPVPKQLTRAELVAALQSGDAASSLVRSFTKASTGGATVTGDTLAGALRDTGADVRFQYTIIDAVAARVPATIAARLRELSAAHVAIEAVEKNGIVRAMSAEEEGKIKAGKGSKEPGLVGAAVMGLDAM
ncbi:hypothetical protein AMAG_14449 [Allomyces macrogynus ATCC 38327]|uniref:Inhibitor I9 domain-containing protein n=1 Tax=Allomyces macrogynus (strain ATCC 38327) TaxID=578462 RepID=A0A0L0T6B8_ALLM3|nr:hypothetical protein AMAG_14449 [Allomyces macrogynus ATCC 38327]|eukprot:KNE70302.1 hypothetical protein AMAG_14449 [Allomyces macrogynus ATCC 38327]